MTARELVAKHKVKNSCSPEENCEECVTFDLEELVDAVQRYGRSCAERAVREVFESFHHRKLSWGVSDEVQRVLSKLVEEL